MARPGRRGTRCLSPFVSTQWAPLNPSRPCRLQQPHHRLIWQLRVYRERYGRHLRLQLLLLRALVAADVRPGSREGGEGAAPPAGGPGPARAAPTHTPSPPARVPAACPAPRRAPPSPCKPSHSFGPACPRPAPTCTARCAAPTAAPSGPASKSVRPGLLVALVGGRGPREARRPVRAVAPGPVLCRPAVRRSPAPLPLLPAGPVNGRMFAYFTQERSWGRARDVCRTLNRGELATFRCGLAGRACGPCMRAESCVVVVVVVVVRGRALTCCAADAPTLRPAGATPSGPRWRGCWAPGSGQPWSTSWGCVVGLSSAAAQADMRGRGRLPKVPARHLLQRSPLAWTES